jgi:hypothetical protein
LRDAAGRRLDPGAALRLSTDRRILSRPSDDHYRTPAAAQLVAEIWLERQR